MRRKNVIHKAQVLETKARIFQPFIRVPCACGWVGAWWTSKKTALKSFRRHQRTAEAQR